VSRRRCRLAGSTDCLGRQAGGPTSVCAPSRLGDHVEHVVDRLCGEAPGEITDSGLVPVAARAMPRCALVSWQSRFSIVSVIELQSAGCGLERRESVSAPMG